MLLVFHSPFRPSSSHTQKNWTGWT